MSHYTVLMLAVFFLFCASPTLYAQQEAHPPLSIGYALSIDKVTPETMRYAKSKGVEYIEVSFGSFIDQDRNFKQSEKELANIFRNARKAADQAGIQIWSVHMPFGPRIDLSLLDETERKEVVALHRRVLKLCQLLDPKIILFHPSFYLGLNEREARTAQLVKSVRALNKDVKKMNATLVIENMLGPELLVDEQRERPLCRTVEEIVAIMDRLPKDAYAAVDMNHIQQPEKLIRALGPRLKSVHIADGNGQKEDHFFPCSGKGSNDWNQILAALEEAGYRGPFLFESAYEDVADFQPCYQLLYDAYQQVKHLK